MRFFATKFSTILPGLLILTHIPVCFGMNSLKIKEIKKEEKVLVTREEIPLKDRWNVEALYSNPEDWKKDFTNFGGGAQGMRWTELFQFKGKLGRPEDLKGFFEVYLGAQRGLEKLYTYAHLRMDEDLGNDSTKSDFGLISTLIHEFSLKTSWVEPELLSLKEDQFQALLEDATLLPYQFYLKKIGRMRPHSLSPEQEELLALSGKALDTGARAFGALNNADLFFDPAIDSEGKEHPLSTGSYLLYLRSPDRALRKSAFKNLHKAYESHINTICEILQGHVQSHLFLAKARKFESCLDAALFQNEIDRSVYESLISSVRAHLPLMHEYVALRKKMLGLEEIHPYDLYVPLIDEGETSLSYDEAKEAVIASVLPLGKEYQEALKKGLVEDRWVDVYENKRKRSGAYSSGCYDSMPYILMNFHGTLNDVLTLAHEAGHSMHSFLSRRYQPYVYAQYPIFVAEVASTFNEQLLLKHLKEKSKERREKAFLTNYQIEGIRGTIFRQTLFAEFELQIHKWVEEGVTLTPALLKEKYLELHRDYYGPDVVIDPELQVEWARIPHFFYNFYVYQYATGLSAALSLFEKSMGSEEAKQRYLHFLSSGGSKFPIDLLQGAGVDMKKTETVNAALEQFKRLLKEFQDLL